MTFMDLAFEPAAESADGRIGRIGRMGRMGRMGARSFERIAKGTERAAAALASRVER